MKGRGRIMKKIVLILVVCNCLFFLFSCSNGTQSPNVQKDSKETKELSDNKEDVAKKATGTSVDVADDGTFVFLRGTDEKYEFYDIDEKRIYEGILKENCDISCWHNYKQHLYIMVNDRKNKLNRLKDINLKTKEERWLNPPNSVFYIYKDNIYFIDTEETGIVKKTDLECNAVKTINLNSNKEGVSLELIYNDKMYYVIQNQIYTCDLEGEEKQCIMKDQKIKTIFYSFDAIDDRLYFLAENIDNKTCVYCMSLTSFELKEVCEDVSCYVLGENGIYYVSEDDGNVCYKTYKNPENTEKIAMENGSNSILKYGDNGWLIQEQKSVSDGQIYAFNELKGVSKILFQVS